MMGGYSLPPYHCPGGCGRRSHAPFAGPCFDCAMAATPAGDPTAMAYRARMRGTDRTPHYGDEVVVPSQHPDGHWCNGVVNSGHGGAPHPNGQLLIAAPGHAKSNLISVPEAGYGRSWCWPEDLGMRCTGTKTALLEDVEG